jgi:hypothetical protein
VNGAGSVTFGVILLRLGVDMLAVDPDVGVQAVILAMSLRTRLGSLLLFMMLYLDLFFLYPLAMLLHYCAVSLQTLSFFFNRSLSELSCIWIAEKR